jgi:hypothetical protein
LDDRMSRRSRQSNLRGVVVDAPSSHRTVCGGTVVFSAANSRCELILPLQTLLIIPSEVQYSPSFRPSRCR